MSAKKTKLRTITKLPTIPKAKKPRRRSDDIDAVDVVVPAATAVRRRPAVVVFVKELAEEGGRVIIWFEMEKQVFV